MNRKRIILFLSAVLSLCIFAGAAEPSEKVLRVLAYNIKHGQGMDGKVDVERIARVIKAQQPDLVALQEVDKHCRRSGNQDIAARLGELLGMEHRFGKAIPFQGGEYGNAVLSRLPIKSATTHALPKSSEPRAALEVVVEVQGKPMSFVSLHLERNSGGQRNAQTKALVELFTERPHPVILAGDYNAARWSEPMKVLTDAGWDILKKNDGKDIRTFHGEKKRADSATTARVEIDYLVVRGLPKAKITHGVIPEEMASDHRPIYGVFEWGK